MRKTVGILRTQENVHRRQHFGPSQLRMQGSQSLHYSVLPPVLTLHWTLSSPFLGACLILVHALPFPPHILPMPTTFVPSRLRASYFCLQEFQQLFALSQLKYFIWGAIPFPNQNRSLIQFLPSYYFLSFTKCLLGKLCKFGNNFLSIYWC